MSFKRKLKRFAPFVIATLLAAPAPLKAAVITIINQDDPGEGFNETTPATPVGGNPGTTIGEQRLNVFNEAAARWGALLQSSVEIRVQAKFDPLPPGVLGSAGPINAFADFANAPVAATLYPVALANAIAGQDLDPTRNDINVTFSTLFTFYMGFDGNPPPVQSDLLLVAMHEIGHGLGFLTFVNGATGAKLQGLDDHYMRFLIDATNNKLWPDMSNAERATSAESDGNLQWSGANAKAAASGLSTGNGTLGPRMFAPPTLQGGSSVSHWDSVFVPDELMEPSETPDPQQFMTEALFRDIGWPFSGGGGPITLRIDDPSIDEGNSGSVSLDFTLTLSAAATQDVTVNYATAAGTATQGIDFLSTSGTATIQTGSSTATVSVTVLGDAIQENDETIFLNLSNIAGASLGDNQGRGTIVDDDGIQAFIGDAQVIEGNSGTADLVFPVTLAGGVSQQDVSVNFATADGTAIAGVDYVSTNGALVFPSGLTNLTVTVPVTGDTLPERDETVFVNLTSATNAAIADFQAVGTIVNDDQGSVLSIAGASQNELNSGSRDLLFTVSLQPPAASTVTVDFSTADGTATSGADYNTASGTLTFTPGTTEQTVSVGILGDVQVESNETFFVNLANPSGAFIDIGQATGIIVEDDGGFIHDLIVSRNTNAFDLARAITSSDNTGLAIKEIKLSGHGSATNASSGLFELIGDAPHTYGLSDPGVVISTGDVLDYESGLNETDSTTTAFDPTGFIGTPATIAQEALLDPITGGGMNNFSHFDATQLDIRFDAPEEFDQISFRVSFGSEEFPELVNSPFIDGFGIYLNGTNIAFTGGAPININHTNMTALPGTELDGVISQGGFAIIQFSALIEPGSIDNTLTFIIADTEDGILDSTVYISSLKASAPFTAGNAPAISSVLPASSPINSVIDINGSNFASEPGDNIVFLGPVQAEVLDESTTTRLKVRVPAGASYGHVTVTVGGLTAISPSPFSVSFASNGEIGADAFAASTDYSSNGKPENVIAADLDNDGRPDLVVANKEQNRISIFRNQTIPDSVNPGSLATGIELPTGVEPVGLAAGDLNGDGLLDLVIACAGSDSINVLQNTTSSGFISFSAAFTFDVGSDPVDVAIADLDQDGRPDIAVAESGTSFVSVLKNVRASSDLGHDSFLDRVSFLVGTEPPSLSIGDLDGDLLPDIVAANSFNGPGGNNVSVLRNLGTPGVIDSRTFAARVNHDVSDGPIDVQLADFDGDNLLDIVTSNSDQNTVSILLNNSASPGNFLPADDFASGLSSSRLAIADMNGLGLPDIAVANSSLGTVTLLKNISTTGALDFESASSHSTPDTVLALAFADIDQNGKPEIITGNGNLTVSVLRNTVRSTSTASWTPLDDRLVYGEQLGADHLNATSSTAGNFIYNPPIESVLPAGDHEVVAIFIPNNTIAFTIERITNSFTVLKAPLFVTAKEQIKAYKAPLPELTAEFFGFVNGDDESVLTTLPLLGTTVTQETISGFYPLSITVTGGAADNYDLMHAPGSFMVVPATPNIVWTDPPALSFGGLLTAEDHLTATTLPAVDGAFAYSHPMEPLPPGTHSLTATFTPEDDINYTAAQRTVTIAVNATTTSLTWETPEPIEHGTQLGSGQLNAQLTPDAPGAIDYNPPAGTILPAGSGHVLTATFTPDDSERYSSSSTTVTIDVLKADPAVTWNDPDPITYGTPLDTTDHLNATFDVPGTVVYSPAPGTILNAGDGQRLNLTFTPDDTDNYNVVTHSAFIDVAKADPIAIWDNPAGIVFGTPLTDADQLNASFFGAPVGTSQRNANGGSAEERFLITGVGQSGGLLEIGYSFFNSPDQMQVFYDGELLFDTELISTSGAGGFTGPPHESIQVPYPPGSDDSAEIVMNPGGGGPASIWYIESAARPVMGGSPAYTPPAGTVLNAGDGQPLSVEFTPTDTANYNPLTTGASIDVAKAGVTLTWNDPAQIVHGTPLGDTQLNATVGETTGTFTYNPPTETVLPAGQHQLEVTFIPDTGNFESAIGMATIDVAKANPIITWANPADIQFGTMLGATQLNATANTAGSFTYAPDDMAAPLPVGQAQELTVHFVPDAPQNFNEVTASAYINVVPDDPTISWAPGVPGQYPFTLEAERLNATVAGDIPGDFVYSPPAGTPLDAGQHTLTVVFNPTSPNYNSTTTTIQLTVNQAVPDIQWDSPADIVFGAVLDSTQLNASSAVAGQFEYTPPAGTVLNAGTGQQLSVLFIPDDQQNYTSPAMATATISVLKADPEITWSTPSPIPFGQGLGANELNATADVSGQFVYDPMLGTVLPVGSSQLLTVTFTPDDAANYNAAPEAVLIDIIKASPEIVWAVPADISFGVALDSTQLSAQTADAGITGQFAYSPKSGAVLNVGANQTLTVTFTPDDTVHYAQVQAEVAINVLRTDPVITWNNPAAIAYETPLSSTQLNATANVPGSFTYSPPLGSILDAGAGQTLQASFTPQDAANYNTVNASAAIDVLKLTPELSWSAPSALTFGEALSATQLNAAANIPGAFTYTPPAASILAAGDAQTLTATFTPDEPDNYQSATIETTIDILKATPTLSWDAPAAIVFGDALGSTQLNAAANISGTFDYSPAAGTILNAGDGQSLSVTFTPDDQANYMTASAQVVINVGKATPSVTWNTPDSMVFGTPLGTAELNATASVPGTFDYTPASGTILDAGTGSPLSVVFTPTDDENYTSASANVALDVARATPMLTWNNPAGITFGEPLGTSQLNATAPTAGSFQYFPSTGTVLSAGVNQRLDVLFIPADDANYNQAVATAFIDVAKASPNLAWATPSPILEGDALTSEQLNATADVPGSFVYTPGLGAVLQTGNNQSLQIDFTPDDTVNFLTATLTVQIDVAPGDPTVAIVSPADGSTITPLSDLVIKAQASDNSGIAKVEFFEGQNKLGEALAEPFNYTWMSIPLGDYVLTAVATDTSGRTATSETVTIGVPPAPSSLEISPSTGQITVGLVGENGVTYEVQVSTNLTTWTTLTTIMGTGGEVPVIDSMLASQVGQRFYRLLPISP